MEKKGRKKCNFEINLEFKGKEIYIKRTERKLNKYF